VTASKAWLRRRRASPGEEKVKVKSKVSKEMSWSSPGGLEGVVAYNSARRFWIFAVEMARMGKRDARVVMA